MTTSTQPDEVTPPLVEIIPQLLSDRDAGSSPVYVRAAQWIIGSLRAWFWPPSDQEPPLNLPYLQERASLLLAQTESQNSIARLKEAPDEEGILGQRDLDSILRDNVHQDLEGSINREGTSLAAAVQRHDRARANLRPYREAVRTAWAKNEFVRTLYWLVASPFVAILPLLALTATFRLSNIGIFNAGDGFVVASYGSWGFGYAVWTALVILVIGLFAVKESMERARTAHLAPRWYFWPVIGGGFLTMTAGTSYVAVLDGVFTPVINQLLFYSWWVYLLLIIAAVLLALILRAVHFRVASASDDRFVEEEETLRQQRANSELEFNASQQAADNYIRQSIQNNINFLSNRLGVAASNEWALEVPNYTTERPWRNLTEQYDDLVETSHQRDLWSYIDTLQRASIGIAGERGAGKTSLMHAIRAEIRSKPRELREFLDVWISAPTAIDEKEFLLSVLAKLASTVGVRLTGNSYWPNLPPEIEVGNAAKKRRNMRLALGISTVAAVLVSLAVPWTDWQKVVLGFSILATGPALLLVLGWLWQFIAPTGQEQSRDRKFLYASSTLLEELWFEHKDVTSSSVKVAGIGMDVTGSQSKERVRRPFTLPQLVQVWDDFVEKVATAPGAFGKVVIFIDEVDKLTATSEIGKFMRILKTLFRPLNLFFIVSISEDAYRQFMVRLTTGSQRNEFDSSFDNTKWVELQSYPETYELLKLRITDDPLPRPFVQLIWAISRGNPRDSLRVARDVLQNLQGRDLSGVALELVNEYQLRPLQTRRLQDLKSQLDPQHHQEVSQALGGFARSIAEFGEPANQTVISFDSVLQKVDETIQKIEDILESHPLPDLRQLRADMYCIRSVCHTFRSPDGTIDEGALTQRFKNIDQQPLIPGLWSQARRHLQDGEPELAMVAFEEFRAQV